MLNCDYGFTVTARLAALVFGCRWTGQSANLSVIDLTPGQPAAASFNSLTFYKKKKRKKRLNNSCQLCSLKITGGCLFFPIVIILERLSNKVIKSMYMIRGEIYGYKLEKKGPFTELESVCAASLQPEEIQAKLWITSRWKPFKIHNLFPGEQMGRQGAFAEAFQTLTWPYFTLTTSSHLHKILQHSEWWLGAPAPFSHALSAE